MSPRGGPSDRWPGLQANPVLTMVMVFALIAGIVLLVAGVAGHQFGNVAFGVAWLVGGLLLFLVLRKAPPLKRR
jgi:hypothetical protein